MDNTTTPAPVVTLPFRLGDTEATLAAYWLAPEDPESPLLTVRRFAVLHAASGSPVTSPMGWSAMRSLLGGTAADTVTYGDRSGIVAVNSLLGDALLRMATGGPVA